MRKKDTLYKVNKWNRPAFMPQENLFYSGGLTNAAIEDKHKNPWDYADDIDTTYQYKQHQNGNFTINPNRANNWGTKEDAIDNPLSFKDSFSKEGLMSGLKAGVGGLASGIGGMVGDSIGGLIGGGLSSGAGSAISGVGKGIGSAVGTVNPLLGAAVSAASGIIAGGVNALWGSSVDEEKLQAAKQGTAQLNNFRSDASSFNDVKGIEAVANVQDAYKGGVFTSGDAAKKNAEIRKQREEAMAFAQNSVLNNINNISEDQINNQLANYSAYGGPIDAMNSGMGAIDYGFMSDYLTMKKRQAQDKNKMGNMFAGLPSGMFAFGGDMQTNSADFGTGLMHIGAGGSHEQNKYDGVQLGTDSEGTPNLVEENETVFNDYVYSARIKADKKTKEKFHLPKKKDITYAEISKKLEKEIAERPNDPISKAGFKAQMEALANEQERQKAEMEAARARKAFEALSPEEQTAIMQRASQEEAVAQANQQRAAIAQQQALNNQQMALNQPQMAADSQATLGTISAYGGKLYAPGGDLEQKVFLANELGDNDEALAEPVATYYDPLTGDTTVIGAGRSKPIPVEVTNNMNPLEVVNMLTQQRDQRKMHEYLDELRQTLKERRGRTRIHYYDNGGWMEDLNPYHRWLVDTYGLDEAGLKEFNMSYANALEDLYNILMDDNAKGELLSDLYYSSNFSPDLWNSIQKLGLTGASLSSLTPKQWKALHEDYIKGYNDFVSKYPNIPYGLRMDEGYRKQWDESYEGYEGPRNTETPKEKSTNGYGRDRVEEQQSPQDTSNPNDYGNDKSKNYPESKEVSASEVPETLETPKNGGNTGSVKSTEVLPEEEPKNIPQEEQETEEGSVIDDEEELSDEEIERQNKIIEEAIRQLEQIEKEWGITGVEDKKDSNTPEEESQAPDMAVPSEKSPLIPSSEEKEEWSPVPKSPIGLIPPKEIGQVPIVSPITPAPVTPEPEVPARTPSAGLTPIRRRPSSTNPDDVPYGIGFEEDAWLKDVNPITFPTHPEAIYPEGKGVVPVHYAEWPRYAGLFGPAVGLGMMAAGVGKPDYSALNAAANSIGSSHLADYKTIGNYLTYNPMDIWFEQNRMDSNARATDRAIMNSATPIGSKMAGLLASGYNNQIASGDLYRKALEYNDQKRHQVADFNRGTDMFNAQAYNQNQQFNASALNQNASTTAQLKMQAAREKMDADAGWYNSLYGNVAGLFKGIGDLGRENAQRNMVNWLASKDVFGTLNPNDRALKGTIKEGSTGAARGGKIKRKKGKRRGLTF